MAEHGIPPHLKNIPEEIRNSHLIKALDESLEKEIVSKFDYFASLSELAALIAPQLEWIPSLFPEYTPHTFGLHIARLFRIADEVFGVNAPEANFALGTKAYSGLNPMELFLFTVGLFAHDWGMAIGLTEQKILQAGASRDWEKDPKAGDKKNVPCGTSDLRASDTIVLIPDEQNLLKEFAQERNLPINKDGSIPGLIDAELAEYVRRTHASRSGARVRHFFAKFKSDTDLGDAAAFVCEGHWLDLREIRRRHEERKMDILHNSKAALSAIAVYVRTVDLFDLGNDRTPGRLEDFVGPESPISVLEWEKHRALRPVSSFSHGGTRQITFQGTINNRPDVWAALKDQSRWVDEQFRGGLQLLLHHLPKRYHLPGLDSHIAWDLRTVDFKPIDIRFEFNRRRVFQLLGEELYGNDPYIFLRELLQNAVDATRILRACLQRDDPDQRYDPLITFEVTHQENHDVTIVCADNGIGLDEYVARHYLATVGESYHDSADFRRLGAKVDLIARYGIGFLSCFTVANRVELRTRRYNSTEALKIVIDGVGSQFAIYSEPNFRKAGTEITVHVLGKKLQKAKRIPPPLRVTDYLSRLAGFVEVPILITEHSKKTLILCPGSSPDRALVKQSESPDVIQLGLPAILQHPAGQVANSPISKVIRIHSVSLRDELHLTTCEGNLNFAILESPEYGWIEDSTQESEGPIAVNRKEKTRFGYLPWNGQVQQARAILHILSTNADMQIARVFADGIRVPSGSLNLSKMFFTRTWNEFSSNINVKPSASVQVNAARDRFLEGPVEISEQIMEAFSRHIVAPRLSQILSGPLNQRTASLGRLIADYSLEPEWLASNIPLAQCPLVIHDEAAGYKVTTVDHLGGDHLWIVPPYFEAGFASGLQADWAPAWFEACHLEWKGPQPMLCTPEDEPVSENSLALQLIFAVMSLHFDLETVVLACSPIHSSVPLLCRGYRRRTAHSTDYDAETLRKKAIDNPAGLSPSERRYLETLKGSALPTIFSRSATWADNQYAFYDNLAFNANHPAIQWLARCNAARLLRQENTSAEWEAFGEALENMQTSFRLHFGRTSPDFSHESTIREHLSREWDQLSSAALEIPELRIHPAPPCPKAEEFVPGTLIRLDSEDPHYSEIPKPPFRHPFGQLWQPAK